MVQEARILGVEAPSSHRWPSRRALAQWECGQGADRPRSFLSHIPLPQVQLQLQSQTESHRAVQRWLSRLSSPPQQREQRAGVGSPSPKTQCCMCQGRENKLLNEEQEVQHPVLLPPPQGPLFRQHRLGGSGQSPPLRMHLQGEVCAVQKMCVCWGTKSLNLGVGGQLGGEVPVLGFPHIRWGK